MPDRLSALDAAFLFNESARTPMHVGAVSIFEGGPLRDAYGHVRIDAIRDLLDARLSVVPRFRKRVVSPPLRAGLPLWVDDPAFDIRHHVKLVALPGPGSRKQLFELASTLHMEVLDRSRPLWEVWIVDGLADGRVAMVQKTHHALVDGVSGVDAAVAMLDLSPEPREVPVEEWEPEAAPSTLDLARAGAVRTVFDPAARSLRWALTSLRDPRARLHQTRRLWRSLNASPASVLAPRTPLNAPIGTTRTLASVLLSLDEVKAVGKHHGGAKVNDVVLSVVAGGLRRWYEERGEPAEVRPHVMVPVSVRTGGERLGLGNRVSSMTIPIPIDLADPLERLNVVAAATASAKEGEAAVFMGTLLTFADALGAVLPTLVSAAIHRQPLVNLVVTNVPGSPVPLYLLGARLHESVPIVPLAGNLDVSIGVLSYERDIAIGLFADVTTCPDVNVIAEGIEKSFVDLQEAEVTRT
jgi:diacylglycerol O-acyltransferase / wax synthase